MRRTSSAFDPSLSRRSFVKGSALATGAFFINSKFNHLKLADTPTSPFTTPWVTPLPFPRYATPLPSWQPLAGPPVDPSEHQFYNEFQPQYIYDDFQLCASMIRPHPQLNYSQFSTFCGCLPGPTFMMKYGKPALVRMKNCMPSSIPNFGSPETTTHVHNGHHASNSDGTPFWQLQPGTYRDMHYPNVCAGFTMTPGGDPLEAKHTLWYHDHCLDFTSQNVYRGLAGFFFLFDDKDTGDERDAVNPDAFRLPSGIPDGKRVKQRYDIPLMLIDMLFDQTGVQMMDTSNLDGHLGDKFTVNGAIQPFFEVERRKYRFRILDAGPSRFYDIWFSNSMEFQHIANDGNLLPAPITVNHVKLGVAERADIIVDFSQVPASTNELYLVNRAEQTNGRGPTGNTLPMTTSPKLLKFVLRQGATADPSRVPATLMPRPAQDLPVVRERNFHFDRANGMWTVNGQIVDLTRCDAEVTRNTAEIWNLSTAGGWAHPVHSHLEEQQVISYNGQPVLGTGLGGRKDVYALYPGDQMKLYVKFRDYLGKYVMHCHNVVHEDHAMMIRFDLV